MLGVLILLFIAVIGLYSRAIIIKGFQETASASIEIAEMQDLVIKVERLLMPVNDYLISGERKREKARFYKRFQELRQGINLFTEKSDDYQLLVEKLVPHIGLLEQIGEEIFNLEIYEFRNGAKLMYEFDEHGESMQKILNAKVNVTKQKLYTSIDDNKKIVNTLNFIMLMGSLIVGSLGLMFIFYLDKNIRSPLEEISTSVKTLDTTKWDKVNVETFNEVSILADEYNKMVDRLKDSYDNLESLVQKRTVDLENANKKLEKLALTDGLTGLYNHRHFMESLSMEFDRSARYGHKLSLMVIDIDFFKKYNDTYGHLVGDEVLRCVADTLQENVRDVDFVARYGGEEFCIYLPEIDIVGAMAMAERQRIEIEKCTHCANISVKSGKKPQEGITISIGVATFPDHTDNASDLIKVADDALFVAKDNGRNRVEMAQALKSSKDNDDSESEPA